MPGGRQTPQDSPLATGHRTHHRRWPESGTGSRRPHSGNLYTTQSSPKHHQITSQPPLAAYQPLTATTPPPATRGPPLQHPTAITAAINHQSNTTNHPTATINPKPPLAARGQPPRPPEKLHHRLTMPFSGPRPPPSHHVVGTILPRHHRRPNRQPEDPDPNRNQIHKTTRNQRITARTR
ncbi:hypothetical protein Dimus_038982 [Dionaea muscipula]